MLLPDNPPLINAGNILLPVIPEGIHALHPNSGIILRPLTQFEQNETNDEVSVSFSVDHREKKGRQKKRARNDERLFLEIANGSKELYGSISVSLPKSSNVLIAATGESPKGFGVLQRTLPRDITPNLPIELGEQVDFVTLTAVVPPLQSARLCSCSSSVEKSGSGFVFLAGLAKPHPNPNSWMPPSRILSSFPLKQSPSQNAFLCTQGFGGAGHHRGLKGHHAADFMCDEGTQVLAVFDGIVTVSTDKTFIGGAHVDLLPEANTIHIRSTDGLIEAVYLHLAPLSCTVLVGDNVKAGDVIAKAGNTGYSTGAHLHLQIDKLEKLDIDNLKCVTDTTSLIERSTIAWSLPWESQKGSRPLGIFPVAGYKYNSSGLILPTDSLDLLRSFLGLSLSSENTNTTKGLKQLIIEGLLWMKPLLFSNPEEEDETKSLPLSSQSVKTALRAYPSLHTCLVSNVLAFVSLLREGSQSRFVKETSIPPVYLSCALNFERDPLSGELFSVEPVCVDQQIESMREYKRHKEVRLALDPVFRNDFLAYFKHEFVLEALYEVWTKDGAFIRNERGIHRPLCLSNNEEIVDIFSFFRSNVNDISSHIRSATLEKKSVFGISLVFRAGPSTAEPFGIWIGFCKHESDIVFIDLQNSTVHDTILAVIQSLTWEEEPRNECFYSIAR
jgi:murein DD-endopeptidase MepM/ murein hydrolase activator NlpD